MSKLSEEKVVFVEKRYCDKCGEWTESPANYCKNCATKLTYSPQKCSTNMARVDDVEELIRSIQQLFKEELDKIIRATKARNMFFKDEPEEALKVALKKFWVMQKK